MAGRVCQTMATLRVKGVATMEEAQRERFAKWLEEEARAVREEEHSFPTNYIGKFTAPLKKGQKNEPEHEPASVSDAQ